MRVATLTRRTLAVTAVTALIASGGFVAATPAWAAPAISGVSPNAGNNTTDIDVRISGTGFSPATPLSAPDVVFHPTFTGLDVEDIVGTVSNGVSSTTLTVNVDLTQAAPGAYDVIVTQAGTSATETTTCPACFTVNALGAATASTIGFGSGSNRPAIPLNISGQNIAFGATGAFLDPGTCLPDPKLVFTPGDPAAADYGPDNEQLNSGAYPAPVLQNFHGSYAAQTGFTPGRHLFRISNLNTPTPATCSSGTVEFWQPFFAVDGVSPATRGIGSTNQVVTVTGAGIRQGSTLSIQDLDTAAPTGNPLGNCTDVSVGASTVNAAGTTISAPVSLVDSCGNAVSTAGRTVTISGPDGARFSVPNAFTGIAAPRVTSLSPSTLGQGAVFDVTVTGTGFSTDVNKPTVFGLGGGGVSYVLKAQTSASQNVLTVTVPNDAVVGGRSVSATNADFGTTTTGPTTGTSGQVFPFNVAVGPIVNTVTPSSLARSSSRTVVLRGTDFDGTNGVTVAFSGTGVTVPGNPVVNAPTSGDDTITMTVNVDAAAPFGLRDIVVTNKGDNGSFRCVGCFGVDSLTVTPGGGANTNTALELTLGGNGMTNQSVATLTRIGADPSEAISAPVAVTNGVARATVNLLSAAPGRYNVVVTIPGGTALSCSGCFTVTGQVPAFAATAPITPNTGGQGATGRAFTVKGTNFDKGTGVAIAGLTVRNVTFVNSTTLTGVVDIPAGTATGDKAATLTETDGTAGSNASTYTVTAAPVGTSVSPAALGQGANNQTITISGSGFVGATSPTAAYNPDTMTRFDLGAGITITDATKVTVTQGATADAADTLTAPITIAATADPTKRVLTLVNPDGGTGTRVDAFTVNAGPKVDAVSPNLVRVGATGLTLTLTGSGFASNATVTIAGFTQSEAPTVAADGKSLTVKGAIAGNAAKGSRAVTVLNPTDKGSGSCSACFTIGDVPGAPAITSVVPGDRSLTVNWTAPSDDGGSAITGYTVSAGTGTTPVTVAADARTATITGLAGATTYTVTVVANNGLGSSAPATAQGTTKSDPAKLVTLTNPQRLLDTRNGTGAPRAAVGSQSTLLLQVTGRGGIPATGVGAVVLNVTAVTPTSGGYLTVYPTGTTRPTVSNLNFTKGQTVPNLVVVPVDASGRVSLFNGSGGTVHLLGDAAGYYTAGSATAPGAFGGLAPTRLLDTRSGGGAVAPKGTASLQVTGRGGVPSTGVAAVILNVTAVAPVSSGFVTVFPSATSRPTVSNLNFTKGQTVANLVVVPVGTDGKVSLFNGSSGRTHLLADVAGYYASGTPTIPGAYGAVTPNRLLDTRNGTGAVRGTVAPQGSLSLQVTGRGGVPTTGVAAVVLNVTVAAPTSSGFLTVWPAGAARPTASNLNFVAGQTVPNLVVVPVGTDGKVSLFNGSRGTTHLLADVAGYFLK